MKRTVLGWLTLAGLCVVSSGCGGGDAGPVDAGSDAGGGDSGEMPVDAGGDAGSLEALDCEVAIIGGGAGGLHTAFRLAPEMGDGVCLFEREAELGGRIHDVPRDPMDPESPRMGTGALRVMEGQTVLFDLATELGITLQEAPGELDLINARGGYAFGKEAFTSRYPGLTVDPGGDTETAHYDLLRMGPNRAMVTSYPDFRSYIRSTVGASGFDFLHDMSRFRADFEYPLDARGYLDYLDEEWDVCCTASYPVGGMSEFIRGMQREATTDGARIFVSEPVRTIDSDPMGGYSITTGEHAVHADRVVIAVPPHALQFIEGDVVDRIRDRPEFQAIIGVEVVTITQWWDRTWWRDVRDPATPESHIWRAWTTEHCVNFVEMPLHAYGVDQMVTRSVYDDDLSCVNFWQETYRAGGVAAIEAEVRRGLEHLFDENGLTAPSSVDVPMPVRTHYQYWPDAWHWIRAGADVTNQQVFDWAAIPLGEGEQVAMVGEAYHPRRSGWSDGAYKSSINLLNTRYGMSLSTGGMAVHGGRSRRGQGGH